MEKELFVTPPEGYEIDKNKSTLEHIIFKPVNKPTSWDEFFQTTKKTKGCYYGIYSGAIIAYNRDTIESFLKLLCLYKAWVGKWKPNLASDALKFCIIKNAYGQVKIDAFCHTSRTFTFSTEEMANDFLNTFEDLFEQAKDLI